MTEPFKPRRDRIAEERAALPRTSNNNLPQNLPTENPNPNQNHLPQPTPPDAVTLPQPNATIRNLVTETQGSTLSENQEKILREIKTLPKTPQNPPQYIPFRPIKEVGTLNAKKLYTEENQEVNRLIEYTNKLIEYNYNLSTRLATLENNSSVMGGLVLLDIVELVSKEEEKLELIKKEITTEQANLSKIQSEILDVRGSFSVQQYALYDFEHPAENSVKLSEELARTREQIKAMVKHKQAIKNSAPGGFLFNNSAKEGQKFINDLTKSMLGAYNTEAENCVKTTRAGNIETARKRLNTAAERVKTSGRMIGLEVNPEYQNLRLKEIELANRHLIAKEVEKETERENRARLREEEKVVAELNKEKMRLEKERREAERKRIELERQLQQEANERLEKERQHKLNVIDALQQHNEPVDMETSIEKDSRLQQLLAEIKDIEASIDNVDGRQANIKAGYVYVVSNIGSFGENIVKIGMTRRVNPQDRVRELSGSSVPFRFDSHMIMFSEDAYGLEAQLHRDFASRRVNKVNNRKEYFYATPKEVLDKLKEYDVDVLEYQVKAEAEEYYQSMSIQNQSL